MATILGEEVRQVQNPALGALLQWRFVVGYSGQRNDASGCPLPLVFIVLPILLHEETYRHVASTRVGTGLRAFTAKFGVSATSEGDVLLSLHDRARAMRRLSRDSIRIATMARLLVVDVADGTVFSLSTTFPKHNVPESIRPLAKNAEKLGAWTAALTLPEIASILKIRF